MSGSWGLWGNRKQVRRRGCGWEQGQVPQRILNDTGGEAEGSERRAARAPGRFSRKRKQCRHVRGRSMHFDEGSAEPCKGTAVEGEGQRRFGTGHHTSHPDPGSEGCPWLLGKWTVQESSSIGLKRRAVTPSNAAARDQGANG